MGSNNTIERLYNDIETLKAEVLRLSAQRPLFYIDHIQQTTITISADQNNYDPGNFDILILAPDAARTIRGFTGGTVGRMLYVRNQSAANNLLFTHNDAAASAGNKLGTTTAGTITLLPRRSALFVYAVHSTSFWMMLFPDA